MLIENARINWYKFDGLKSTTVSLKEGDVVKQIKIKGAYHFGIGLRYDFSINDNQELEFANLTYSIS